MKLRLFACFCAFFSVVQPGICQEKKPHVVFVVGTPHYNPASTMVPLAKQLEENYGFRTTVILPKGNPEKNKNGMEGLEALKTADVAIFYLRFLTLPKDQLSLIEEYLESGKPVVGFRTTTHAFIYPEGHELHAWNDGFGKRAMGSKYFIHAAGPTRVEVVQKARGHEILTGYNQAAPREVAGTLYLSDIPKTATVLMTGTGKFKRTGEVTNQFGTHKLEAEMTDDVAWTWKNEWGGRVFGTTLGHPKTFADENFVRLFINGIHWAAGKPVPPASSKVQPITAEMEKKKQRPKKAKTG
ncbi:MAG: hypothetical protein HKN23_09235 [Verrucomicrobiales bacterium]|nr:hypothetical protein [Verrucomicrobiales bacterium]